MESATVVDFTYMKSTTAVLNSYEMCYPYNHLILNIRRPKNYANMNRPVGHFENSFSSGELVQQTWKIRADPKTLIVYFFLSSFTFVEDPPFPPPAFATHWLSCRTEAGRGIEGGTSQLCLSRCGRSGFLRFPLFAVFQHGQEKDNPPSTEVSLL